MNKLAKNEIIALTAGGIISKQVFQKILKNETMPKTKQFKLHLHLFAELHPGFQPLELIKDYLLSAANLKVCLPRLAYRIGTSILEITDENIYRQSIQVRVKEITLYELKKTSSALLQSEHLFSWPTTNKTLPVYGHEEFLEYAKRFLKSNYNVGL